MPGEAKRKFDAFYEWLYSIYHYKLKRPTWVPPSSFDVELVVEYEGDASKDLQPASPPREIASPPRVEASYARNIKFEDIRWDKELPWATPRPSPLYEELRGVPIQVTYRGHGPRWHGVELHIQRRRPSVDTDTWSAEMRDWFPWPSVWELTARAVFPEPSPAMDPGTIENPVGQEFPGTVDDAPRVAESAGLQGPRRAAIASQPPNFPVDDGDRAVADAEEWWSELNRRDNDPAYQARLQAQRQKVLDGFLPQRRPRGAPVGSNARLSLEDLGSGVVRLTIGEARSR